MASKRKKRIVQSAQKRESRGRIYIVAILLIVIGAGVGWFVYSSTQSSNSGTPDFGIAAPAGVTVQAGQQTTSNVNVTAINRFNGAVHLSVASSSGLTASISPATITGSGTATLTMSATINGTFSVTVTGTSGNLTHAVSPKVATPIYAVLRTTDGNMTIELFQAQAPQTVTNFANLANQGFYTNLVWHRIVAGFVIQTGDPNSKNGLNNSTWGQGGSSQKVPLEIDPTLHNNVGYLGMARGTDPNSGSSQFYINLANNNSLDGQYTVFGKVISSMAPANAIAATPVYSSDQPINPVYLTSVTILP